MMIINHSHSHNRVMIINHSHSHSHNRVMGLIYLMDIE